MEFRVAIKAVVEKDGKILVIKRSSSEEVYQNLWDLPGGKMEFGETPIEAIKREVKEETSLDVEILEPFSMWSFIVRNKQVFGVTIRAKYISGEVKLSQEHTEYKWLWAQEFLELDADAGLKNDIKKYISNMGNL